MLTIKLIKKKLSINEPISKALSKEYRNVSLNTTLAELGRILGTRHSFALVDNKFIVSSFDLLNFINKK